ncbi:MAG: DUF1566 domain-containing protein [Deltaproteobacteria bacterium]|nr:DUF1566 domain-containing protein [Deltaproteobacteria bacterium]
MHKKNTPKLVIGIQLITVVLVMLLSTSLMAATVYLPKTGQTTCYDANGSVIDCAGTGQDGDTQTGMSWPDPRFTDNGNGAMTDNLTGLMWTQSGEVAGAGQFKTWQQALDFVAGMNAGTNANYGYTDWRLPNIVEIMSLSNKGVSSLTDWLSEQGFTNVYPFKNWTSTTLAGSPDNPYFNFTANAYIFNVASDHAWVSEKTASAYLWPVRAGQQNSVDYNYSSNVWKTGQTSCYDSSGNAIDCTGTGQDGELQWGVAWPDPRLTDNGDGTLTDNLTGLTWMKDLTGPGEMTWQQGLDYAAQLNNIAYLGRTSWQVPNATQLLSLMEFSGENLLPNALGFAETQSLKDQGFFTSLPEVTWGATSFMYFNSQRNAETFNFRCNSIGFRLELNKLDTAYVVAVAVPPEPNIAVSPLSHDFGDISVGSEAILALAVVITNVGNATLTLGWPFMGFLDRDDSFVKVSSTCGEITNLAPGESCEVRVQFRPTTAGYHENYLRITSNDPDTPSVMVTLTGRGTD